MKCHADRRRYVIPFWAVKVSTGLKAACHPFLFSVDRQVNEYSFGFIIKGKVGRPDKLPPTAFGWALQGENSLSLFSSESYAQFTAFADPFDDSLNFS